MQPEMQEFLDNARAFEQRMRDAETSLRQAVDPGVFEHRDPDRLAAAIAEAAAANARGLAEQRMGPVEINLY
jgi:hypothetical protein